MDVDRAARIQALIAHPAFVELQAEVAELRDKYASALSAKMLADGEPFDNFEYKRGYWDGLLTAVRYPEKAVKTLERDLAKSRKQEENSE